MMRGPSLRTRILLLVLGVAVVPLALTGAWLTGSTARSGEALLRTRLAEELTTNVTEMGQRWIPYRSMLVDVAEHPDVLGLLEGSRPIDGTDTAGLVPVLERLPPEIASVTLLNLEGSPVWRTERASAPSPLAFGTPLRVSIDVRDRLTGGLRGRLQVSLLLQALLRDPTREVPGAIMAAFDEPEGTLLTPVPLDPLLFQEERFEWREGEWITSSATLREPELTLVAAAPLAPFVGPFREAAREGGLILLLTAVVGIGVAAVVTGRMTRSLEALAAAAESVSRGELEPAVGEGGEDEIGRVARAFAQMTRSLRDTLARLADQEALAAVGEFAASLAHEVRNPLTAIRLDLQQVEERLLPGSPERELQRKALDSVLRLNRTVTGALETARTGRGAGAIDVHEPLTRAVGAARPVFDEAGVTLEAPMGAVPVPVHGDPEALESAFLNVLLNAGQATSAGGRAGVTVRTEEGQVYVIFEDDGPGIPREIADRVFEPLVSRREGGTGLGLPITRRILEGHGGGISLESAPGGGTRVTVRLPAAGEPVPTMPSRRVPPAGTRL